MSTASDQSEPQIPAPARRRRSFTAQYKLDILAAYDAAGPGRKSKVLRGEGLYSSHIVEWRRARDTGALAALARHRGRPAVDQRDEQIAQLLREKSRLEQDLAQARYIGSVQAKAAKALGAALRATGHRPEADAVNDEAIAALAPSIGIRAACAVVGESQASYYRRSRAEPSASPARSS